MARAATTSDVFNAIAEPRRREILELLAEGARAVGELVQALRLPQPTVSKHLGVLRRVGLVSVRKNGQKRVYALNAEELRPVYDWAGTFEQFWAHKAERIKARAERMAREAESPSDHRWNRKPNGARGSAAPTRRRDMALTQQEQEISTISIEREVEIAAPPRTTFEAVLEELGPGGVMPDGTPFPMKVEPWPGGRWFRDLSDGGEARGHLWGHVQVIKAPSLLELCGPMFMSYPGVNFVQYRLTEEGRGTRLKITHKAFGQIPEDHREGVGEGWEHGLKRIREIAEAKVKG